MSKDKLKFKKLNDIIEQVKEKNEYFETDIINEDIELFNLFLKSEEEKTSYLFKRCLLLSYNYIYQDNESLLFIFSIPSYDVEKNKNSSQKSVNENILNLIKIFEEYFVYIDYINIKKEGQSNQFNYLIIIKKI